MKPRRNARVNLITDAAPEAEIWRHFGMTQAMTHGDRTSRRRRARSSDVYNLVHADRSGRRGRWAHAHPSQSSGYLLCNAQHDFNWHSSAHRRHRTEFGLHSIIWKLPDESARVVRFLHSTERRPQEHPLKISPKIATRENPLRLSPAECSNIVKAKILKNGTN